MEADVFESVTGFEMVFGKGGFGIIDNGVNGVVAGKEAGEDEFTVPVGVKFAFNGFSLARAFSHQLSIGRRLASRIV